MEFRLAVLLSVRPNLSLVTGCAAIGLYLVTFVTKGNLYRSENQGVSSEVSWLKNSSDSESPLSA